MECGPRLAWPSEKVTTSRMLRRRRVSERPRSSNGLPTRAPSQDGLDRPSGQKQPGRAALLDLLDVVDAADYAASELGISAVRKAAEAGAWRAGAWFLEHRYPTTWGRMDRPADTPADTTPDTYAESSKRLMDYLRSLPEPTCATCGADAVDAPDSETAR